MPRRVPLPRLRQGTSTGTATTTRTPVSAATYPLTFLKAPGAVASACPSTAAPGLPEPPSAAPCAPAVPVGAGAAQWKVTCAETALWSEAKCTVPSGSLLMVLTTAYSRTVGLSVPPRKIWSILSVNLPVSVSWFHVAPSARTLPALP